MEDPKETNRLEAFSDGVFAVAITLLVLNIKIPGIDLSPGQLASEDGGQLLRTLFGEWPMLAAYVTSFATIGVMWLNHHRLFTHIRRIDTMLILLNLFLLLIIVFVPVPTALLAQYISYQAARTAALIYSGTSVILACLFNLLWRYASYHNRLLGKNIDSQSVAGISTQYLFGPGLYLLTFGVAWLTPQGSVILIFAIALFFALPGRTVLKTVAASTNSDDSEKEPEEKASRSL